MSIEAIREALEAGPTEGPWRYWSCRVDSSAQPPMYDYAQFANPTGHVFRAPLSYLKEADARLIAACNPTAIRALLQRLEEAEKALQWRDIETAPKDGTVIALRRCQRVHSGRWGKGAYSTGWLATDSDFVFAFGLIDPPTHWMPLPPAPAIDSAAQKR